MAEGSKGNLIRLGLLAVVLAAVGGFYFFQSTKPPKGGNLDRIVNEDSAGIIAEHKTLDEVKKIFKHESPEAGLEPGLWLFDFSKVDPDNKAKVEVMVKGGKVVMMREFDERVPPPKPPTPRDPNDPEPPEDPPADEPPADAPAEQPDSGGGGGGGG